MNRNRAAIWVGASLAAAIAFAATIYFVGPSLAESGNASSESPAATVAPSDSLLGHLEAEGVRVTGADVNLTEDEIDVVIRGDSGNIGDAWDRVAIWREACFLAREGYGQKLVSITLLDAAGHIRWYSNEPIEPTERPTPSPVRADAHELIHNHVLELLQPLDLSLLDLGVVADENQGLMVSLDIELAPGAEPIDSLPALIKETLPALARFADAELGMKADIYRVTARAADGSPLLDYVSLPKEGRVVSWAKGGMQALGLTLSIPIPAPEAPTADDVEGE